MIGSKLIDKIIPAHTNNYTKGRVYDGVHSTKINGITIHHCAGVLNIDQIGAIFQNPNRSGSSHYGIGNDGKIVQMVSEEDTAWTNGNWISNCESVTIEVSNSFTGGKWLISNEALNSLIKLVADIAKRNNLVPVAKLENLTWHSLFAPTLCPGQYLLSKMDYIVNEANKLINNGEVKEWAPGNYRLIETKIIRSTPKVKVGNELKVKNLDATTRQYLTSSKLNDNAKFKVGTEVYINGIIKEQVGKETRIWGKFANVYLVLCNKDGTPQAEKI